MIIPNIERTRYKNTDYEYDISSENQRFEIVKEYLFKQKFHVICEIIYYSVFN